MSWCILLHVFSLLSFAITSTLAISMALPHCQETCGNVTIPYPFGIGSNCSANSSFVVICKNSTTPFLSSINMEVQNISISGVLIVNHRVSPMNCSDKLSEGSLPISLTGSPFTISASYNTLSVIGCNNSVWLRANRTTTMGGCTPLCDANSTESSCNGVNCCQTTIPPRLKELHYTYKTTEATGSGNSSCGYVLPVYKTWLDEDYKSFKGLFGDMSNPINSEPGFAPLLLEWEFGDLKGYTNASCTFAYDYCFSYPDEFGYRYTLNYIDSAACQKKYIDAYCSLYPTRPKCLSDGLNTWEYSSDIFLNFHSYMNASSIKYCHCPYGYEGNPYLPQGCTDVDECQNETENRCGPYPCTNVKGDFECQYPDGKRKAHLRIAFISLGSGIGALILVVVTWRSTKAIRKRIKANRRRKFFKRNGGLLLEQQLSATDNGVEKTRLYSSKELKQATDHYNENRILGHGGQGTVYKGMLKDGKIVAVKKSIRVDEGDLGVFINEVVILSQVNHRNVVKLLGCCLETEVPLLVYEYIPNGTLFQHIHKPSEEFPLTWEMRVRIAREVAHALAYLHSSATSPIYHRDIKSTNILLDDKYRAKVSDFGTSRSVALDQTHCTTRVLGTYGYLDPEYFQSNQFTEKSDVYSFGVVLVELLTGEKAISCFRVDAGRSLATHFLHSMEENQLFDILDARVLREGKREEIKVVAHLARRCLHLTGKRRPTMRAVAAELESIKEKEDNGGNIVSRSTEIAESLDFSSISQSLRFDTVSKSSLEIEHPLLRQS